MLGLVWEMDQNIFFPVLMSHSIAQINVFVCLLRYLTLTYESLKHIKDIQDCVVSTYVDQHHSPPPKKNKKQIKTKPYDSETGCPSVVCVISIENTL